MFDSHHMVAEIFTVALDLLPLLWQVALVCKSARSSANDLDAMATLPLARQSMHCYLIGV